MIRVPERYKDVSYKDVTQNVKEVFEKVKETRQGLYLFGGVGTGKTHIAYALYKQAREGFQIRSRFYNVTELLRSMRNDYNLPFKLREFPENKLIEFNGLIFLDDLGSEKMTEWVEETLYYVINKKYNDKIPMIVTSNFSLTELSDRVSDRIVSRVAGMCEVVKLEGKDRRI